VKCPECGEVLAVPAAVPKPPARAGVPNETRGDRTRVEVQQVDERDEDTAGRINPSRHPLGKSSRGLWIGLTLAGVIGVAVCVTLAVVITVLVMREGKQNSPKVAAERGKDTAKAQETSNEEQKAAELAKENLEVQAFKEKVAKYLVEARAAVKLLILVPSLEEYRSASKQVGDIYAHLPSVPAAIDTTGKVSTKLNGIMSSFTLGEDTVNFRLECERTRSLDGFKKAIDDSRKIVNVVNKLADEVESEVGLFAASGKSKDEVFREKTAHFLTEARASARLLTLAPSLDEAKAKSKQIRELYLYLPPVPPGIDTSGKVAHNLERLENQPNIGVNLVELRVKAERLGYPAAVDEGLDSCRKLAQVINGIADEIESEIGRNNAANKPATSPVDDALAKVKTAAGIDLVLIPKGEFFMGSPNTDRDADPSEKPRHKVTISQSFYLGKYHVTVGQFTRFVAAAGYQTDAEKAGDQRTWKNPGFAQTDQHPVVCTSWNDADAFCRWLAKETGASVRLPREAEWEYSCRAGTTTRFYFGDSEADIGSYAWYIKNSNNRTRSCGLKKPNAFGLYDMHGLAWQWCSDGKRGYRGQDETDPEGPATGPRVIRGGCAFYAPGLCRAAHRDAVAPGDRNDHFGFRVLVAAKAKADTEAQANEPEAQRKAEAEAAKRKAIEEANAKLSRANFDKIKVVMYLPDVVALLGPSTSEERDGDYLFVTWMSKPLDNERPIIIKVRFRGSRMADGTQRWYYNDSKSFSGP
jgi:formylglycine-generating enzyme required for sulfatase activity